MKAIDTKSWAEFKVGDLFEKLDLKCKKTDFQKNTDLSKIKTDEFNLPLVNAKHGNNGIMYYGREDDWEYAKMTIDIVSDGAVSAGNVYPQPNKTGILYNAYLIKPFKKDITENQLIFLATVIEAYVKQKYSYENKCIWKKLSLDKIQLPIDQTGQPDWNYMEAFMEGINQQAQARLNEYKEGKLEYTTLDTIGYTPVDTESWAEFKVEKLFELLKTTRKVTKLNFSPEGKIPAYSSDTRNNGILGYIEGEPEYLVDDMNKTFLIFGDHTRSMNIAHESFSVMDNVKVLKPKLEMSDEQLLFIITVWKNSIPNLGYSRHWNVAKNTNISLPVKPTIDPDKTYHPEGYIPDWDYMEAFMKQINQQAQAKLDTLEKGKA